MGEARLNESIADYKSGKTFCFKVSQQGEFDLEMTIKLQLGIT